LQNVSFSIEQGQVAALVGPTGAGKTTLVSLIARFYDPTTGVVKIDDTISGDSSRNRCASKSASCCRTRAIPRAGLAQHRVRKPDATRAEILRAAEMANAHEFIKEMPEGYDTIVGERGNTLSGGQRQRVAIARAIIRNTPILILDEPSSGLDAASEKLVFEALDRLMKAKPAS